jgi:hypothetical protein
MTPFRSLLLLTLGGQYINKFAFYNVFFHLQNHWEDHFGSEYAEFLDLMGEIRNQVMKDIPDEEKRRKIFECLVNSNILELIKEGHK